MTSPTTFIDYWIIAMTVLFSLEFLFSLWYFGRNEKIVVLDSVEIS
jgi:hypothetical protein